MLLTNNPNLNKLSYGFALLFIAIGSILQYMTPYFYAEGYGNLGFKVLIILYACIFLANFFAPYFIGRYGSQKMIVVTSILYIISIIGMIMNNRLIIYMGTILLGFSGAILWNSQNNYIIGISQLYNRGKNSGFFVAVYGFGYAFGIYILGYLINQYGYKNAFYMMISFAFGGLYLFSKMEQLPNKTTKKHHVSLFSIRSLTLFKVVLGGAFIQSLLFGLAISLIPFHVQMITNNSKLVGVLSAMFFIMPLLFSVPVGKFSDKHGRGKIILVAIVIALIGLMFFNGASSFYRLLLGMIFISVAQAILFPMFIALQGDISTPKTQPLVTNFFILFKYIGMVLGVILGDVFGAEWAYLISMVIIILVLIFSIKELWDDERLKNRIFEEMLTFN